MTEAADDRREALQARRQLREDLLLAVYDAVGAVPAPLGRTRLPEVTQLIGAEPEQCEDAFHFLAGAGYLEAIASGWTIGMTAQGILAVEEAIEPTDDPAATIDAHELRLVERWISDARSAVDAGTTGLDGEDLAQVQAQLDTIVSQLKAPRPARRVLTWAFRAAGAVLGGVAGNAATAALVAGLPHL